MPTARQWLKSWMILSPIFSTDMNTYRPFPTDDSYKESFPAIRSCSRAEFKEVLGRLLCDKGAQAAANAIDNSGQLLQKAARFQYLDDFQQEIILNAILPTIFAKGVSSVETIGYDKINPSQGCVFLSNHRDIIMDSTLLQSEMYRLFHKPTESAIGDNLTRLPWIHDMTRLCKCFTVRRGLSSPKELYEASMEMSCYIHKAVTEGHEFIWLAQREGRAKDSDDRTQPGILKMLNLSSKSDLKEHLVSLHLTPLCLSYEYDPCDALKARELLMRKLHGFYCKQPGEDITSMKTGIIGKKGKVYIAICNPLDEFIDNLDASLPVNVQIRQIAAQVDKDIHYNYHLSANQCAAAYLLKQTGSNDFCTLPEAAFQDGFNPGQLAGFEAHMEKQLAQVSEGLSKEELHLLRLCFLLVYANPVRNHWTAKHPTVL